MCNKPGGYARLKTCVFTIEKQNGFLFIALLGVCMRSRSFSVPMSPASRFCTIYRTVRKPRFKSSVRLVHSKPRLKLAKQYHTTPTVATPQLFIVAWDTRTRSRGGRFSCRAACCRPLLFLSAGSLPRLYAISGSKFGFRLQTVRTLPNSS